ncbi:MAG TPA: hypothetical protein VF405_11220 [Gammaproteobacteria bacterium]
MLKRIAIWVVVAVAAVMAVQVLLRSGPLPSFVEPPRLTPPALDSIKDGPAADAADAGAAEEPDDRDR